MPRLQSPAVDAFGRQGERHTLIDKVYSELNLYVSARKVTGKAGAAGVDGQSTAEFEEHLIVETRRLGEHLRGSSYQPEAVRRVPILKPGRPNETRPLGIPTVRDRRPTRSVCARQTALVHVIEPILDHQFHERSVGFRHGRVLFVAIADCPEPTRSVYDISDRRETNESNRNRTLTRFG